MDGAWEIEWFASVGSTNDVLAADPRPGRVVVADHQSAGRGRRGRVWQAQPGASLAISAALPAPPLPQQGWVPLAAGVAVSQALEASTLSIATRVKWPNDVLADGPGGWRKICGILTQRVEHLASTGPGAVVIVGSGVNISQREDELPVPTATSWRICAGEHEPSDQERRDFLTNYLARLTDLLADPDGLRERYLRRCDTLGHEVQVHLPGDRIATGRAVDIDPGGALVLERAGSRSTYLAGDVVHLRR